MKPIVLLFIISIVFSQDVRKIDLGTEPLQKDGITLSNEDVIKSMDGFYQRISATYTPDGRLIVFDHGNTKFHVYDKNHKIVMTFGKEGSGPGEIQKNNVKLIKASNKYIYVHQWYEFAIFNMNGVLVKEIKGHQYFQNSRLQIINDQIVFINPHSNFYKISKAIFSEKGELIEEYKYKKLGEDIKSKLELSDVEKDFRVRKNNFQINDKIYSLDVVEYSIHVSDLSRKPKQILHRNFQRVPYEPSEMWFNKKKKKQTKGQKAYYAALSGAWSNIYNGYRESFKEFCGNTGKHYFLRLNTKEDLVVVDVISTKNEWISQLKFQEQGLEYIEIHENKLIKFFKNDEDGPSLKTYDIAFNKKYVRK
jgi:hypothetical protein